MIIDLRAISHAPLHLEFSLEVEWWKGDEEGDRILGPEGPLKADITIEKVENKYALEGVMRGRFRLRCDRCLETYIHPIESVWSLLLAAPASGIDEGEIELFEDDLIVDFIKGSEINLDDVIREQIFLAMPFKSLCKEECSGLCMACGANLNIEECTCQREKRHGAFSKLKGLKANRSFLH
jgi:uncharacterized protein